MNRVSLYNAALRYVTKNKHLSIPAGTECWVWRDHDTFCLKLRTDDGVTIELGPHFYAEGLEPRRQRSFWAHVHDVLAGMIDREVIDDLMYAATSHEETER